MKSTFTKFINRIMLLLAGMFTTVYAFAQEEVTNSVTKSATTTTTTNWYANPWIWVVAAAIFILLFAAIMRGGRRDA